MAWASKKQYAILNNSEEGKDLIEKLPDLSQDEFQVEFGKFIGKSGSSYEEDEEGEEKKSKPSLSAIVDEVSHFTKDKNYDVLDFRKKLENNGFEVEEIENKTKVWKKDSEGEYFKDYDIILKSGEHIFFKLIADDNYDTKEIIAYRNGKY